MRSAGIICLVSFLLLIPVDGQDNWEIINEGIGCGMHTADFINSDTGWIAGWNVILQTKDGGKNWVRYAQDHAWNFLRIDFINDSLGWAITKSDTLDGLAIINTKDGGQNWSLQKTTDYKLMTLYGLTEDIVFAIGDSGILKTINGGSDWTDISPSTGSVFSSGFFLNPDTGLIAGTDSSDTKGVIYSTCNSGETWNETTIPEYNNIFNLKHLNDSTACFLASDEFGRYFICKTTNLYRNWTVLFTNYFPIHRCHFFNNSIISIMSNGACTNILKSTDGGMSWENSNTERLAFQRDFEMCFGTENVGYIIATDLTGNVLLKSVDHGGSWTNLHLTFPFTDVCFFDEHKGYAGGGYRFDHYTSGNVFMTDDGGISWKTCSDIPEHFYPESCLFTNDVKGFIFGVTNTESRLYQTLDGGDEWFVNEFKDFENLSFLMKIFFVNDQIGYLTDGATLFKTSDGGSSWESILQGQFDLNSICFIDDKTGWVSRKENKILKYTAPGNWKEIATGITPIKKIYFVDSKKGWITGGYSRDDDFLPVLSRTLDGGETWTKISDFKYLIHDIYFPHNQHGWAVGEDNRHRGVILETTDGGDNWTVQLDSLSGPLRAIHFKDGYAWAAGDNGLILKLEYSLSWIDRVSMTNAPYLVPGEDTVCITAAISNPGNHPLKAYYIINSQDGAIQDTVSMFNQGGGIWEGTWPVIPGNRFYTVEIQLTRTDTTVINYTSITTPRFTTSGPLVFHDLNLSSSDTVPEPGDSLSFSVSLRNEGSTGQITNITARLMVPDTIATLDSVLISFGDLYPEEVAGSLNGDHWGLKISEDCPYNTIIPVNMDISSNGHVYWSDTFSISVNYPSFTDEADASLPRIYPNPAADIVNIEIPYSDRGRPLVIEFLDITGKTVYMKSYRTLSNTPVRHIDVSGLPVGLYVVKITQAHKIVVRKLIVK